MAVMLHSSLSLHMMYAQWGLSSEYILIHIDSIYIIMCENFMYVHVCTFTPDVMFGE